MHCIIRPAILIILSAAILHAADKAKAPEAKNDAPGWVTGTFRLESIGAYNPERSQNSNSIDFFPSAPSVDAAEAEWLAHIKVSSSLLNRFFTEGGRNLPPGTLFAADSKSSTYAVRTSADALIEINTIAALDCEKLPSALIFEINIVRADAALIREVAKQSHTRADLTDSFHRLRDTSNKKSVRILQTARLETRSGQRAQIETGPLHQHPEGFQVDAQGHVEWKRASQRAGFFCEVDPVIGPDGRTVDLNIHLRHDDAPPTERMEFVDAGSTGRIEVPVTEYHYADFSAAMTYIDGMTGLVGVWKPSSDDAQQKQDVLQAAFLSVNVVKTLPAENKKLAKTLAKIAPKISSLAAPAKPPDVQIPAGMQTRRFKLPPDFITLSDVEGTNAGGPADPFAPKQTKHSLLPRDGQTPIEILKGLGIQFPAGSSAIYDGRTSLLIVTNTPENLEVVESYFDGTFCRRCPHNLVHTLHIFEGNGSTLRSLLEESKKQTDHTPTYEKLEELVTQGKARFISTQHIPTRSGERITFRSGREQVHVTKLQKNDLKDEKPAEKEIEIMGTSFDFDPIVGPDGRIIDFNGKLDFDYAPPEAGNPDGNGVKANHQETRTMTLNRASVTTAFTLATGTNRIFGLWKPGGSAEDDKDLLQIAILSVDILPIASPEPPEEKSAASQQPGSRERGHATGGT